MTNWANLLEDKKNLLLLYDQPPSLSQIEIVGISVERDGPVCKFRVELRTFADHPPQKWIENQYNRVQIEFLAVGIKRISISKWSTSNIADLYMTRNSGGIFVNANTQNTQFSLLCEFLYIARIHGY